jgi:hypothetical protein
MRRRLLQQQQQQRGGGGGACVCTVARIRYILWVFIFVIVIGTAINSFKTIRLDVTSSFNRLTLSTLSTTTRQSCKYDGNCPINTVCENDNGYCLPYYSPSQSQINVEDFSSSTSYQVCVDTCVEELINDEYYYQGMTIQIINTTIPSFRSGCIIRYQKQKATIKPTNISFDEWIHGRRFRRLVRTNPEISTVTTTSNNHSNDNLIWNALCDNPCESTKDCPAGLECIGRSSSSTATPTTKSNQLNVDPRKSCRRRRSTKSQRHNKDMVIVTGSDSMYFSALMNFVASVKYWSPHRQVVIYNLGMSKLQLTEIQKWTNVIKVEWPGGIPKYLPSHVSNVHNYAWKSIIMNETVHKYKSILWIDAGCTITSPIEEIEDIVHWNGIFLVRGQDDDMRRLSHPDTYRWFGYNKETFRHGYISPHYAGGIQGHVYPSRWIDSIVIPNAQCALDETCISPRRSSFTNHRYDQTSLSILCYQDHVQAPSYTEYLASGRDQLNKDLSQPSKYTIWTSRGSCSYYSTNVKLKAA